MSCACKIGGGPDGVCFECKSRRAFNARLKKLEDAKASEEYARGVADERARVVQYLVDRSKQIRGVPRDAVVMLMQSADAIERGEHEEGT